MTFVQKPHYFKYFLDNAPTPSDTISLEQTFFSVTTYTWQASDSNKWASNARTNFPVFH